MLLLLLLHIIMVSSPYPASQQIHLSYEFMTYHVYYAAVYVIIVVALVHCIKFTVS